ncbi:MAG TPA: 5'-nucleotidase C-terminal domain-containing protein [Gemmatimonadaceae bacterium]|nr:5'-nucleotidase C-terminal domain-containing protein [Gemmatimonadaceae bacterium]
MNRFACLGLIVVLAACVAPAARQPVLVGVDEPVAPDQVELLIAATTDVHGRLRGWDYYENAPDTVRGLARAATVVDSLRAAAPGRVVLLDAGDLLQGNPLTYVAARVRPQPVHPVIAAMNAMAYDAAAIGNHEFNYGLTTLAVATSKAQFPFLAANAYAPSGNRAFPATKIIDRAGVRIGVIGATTPGANLWDRDNLKGRVEVRDIVPDVRAAVEEVKRTNADVIVVVMHSGLNEASSYDTVSSRVPSENVAARVAHEVPGIDLIIYGHSHRQMTDTTIGTTTLMQPKNWAQSVAVATVKLQRTAGKLRVTELYGQLIPVAGRAESQKVLDAIAPAHDATVAYVQSTVGTTSSLWRSDSARVRDTPIVDLILEVQRRTTGADLSSGSAFSTDVRFGPGAITVAQLAKLYPYENTLKMVRIKGRQLREYLEYSARYFGTVGSGDPPVDPEIPGYNYDVVSGVDYTIDVSKPIGSRITSLTRNGKPVADTDSFTLALNNYRQSGGGGFSMLATAPVIYDHGQTEIRQLVIDEVKRLGKVDAADVHKENWRLVPVAAIEPAYEAINRLDRRFASTPAAASGDATVRRIRVLATNDFHGALEPRPDARGIRRGGAAHLATAIEQEMRNCTASCAVLLLDGGDMFQGTPASNLQYGKPIVDLYNMLGYTAAALGNHEFDWTVDTLRARMREARFRIMAANVRFENGSDVPWIPDDTLVEKNGIKIGLIGLALEATPLTTRPQNVRGLRFDPPAPVVDAHAKVLRARGAEAIIVLAHIGAFCDSTGSYSTGCSGAIIDLANNVTEKIDAIVSGHTHSRLQTVVKGIPIVQARTGGRALGLIDIPLGGAPTVSVREILSDSVPPSARVDSLVKSAVARTSTRVNAIVARIPTTLARGRGQYPLGNLIADAQRWAGKGDVAVMNNGGIRTDLREGPATYGSLYEIHPFGNSLYRLTVRGSDLKQYLEKLVDGDRIDVHVSGLEIRYDPAKPAGSRVVSAMTSEGRPINNTATYTIVLNDFMVAGGDGLGLGDAALQSDPTGILDLDALISYLRTRGDRLIPPEEKRIVAVTP